MTLDEQEYRDQLRSLDELSLEKRVVRWKRLTPATYKGTLPNLARLYITEAVDMYITEHFIGVVLLCATIAELVLADQLRSKTGMTEKEVEHFELNQMVILSQRLGILSDAEAGQIARIRKWRNALIHANVGQLGKMARTQYSGWGLDIHNLHELGIFSLPPWLGDMYKDVLGHLKSVRELLLKFYGKEDIHERGGSKKSGDS